MKQTAELKEIHKEALKRADEAWQFERENIRKGREDQKFYAGDQWDEAAKKARGTDRPMLTINRLGTFVRQVTGDLRQNPPATKILPSGGPGSEDKADILMGMVRSIEVDSDATFAYVKAGMNVAQAGQGGWRIESYYEDDGPTTGGYSPEQFQQCLRISPLTDPFSLLIDPFCKRSDKSDMAYGFVLDRMGKDAFKAAYPDATPVDFDAVNADPSGNRFQWIVGDSIRTAEYWTREVNRKTIYLLPDGRVVEKLEVNDTATRERSIEEVRITQYIISGTEILSGPNVWPGKYIPLVFVPGEEVTIDGATDRKGMVRDAKDPQRLLNYARTTDAEQTALQPKAPFMVTADQIKGYESIWKSAGTKNHPYLIYNSDGKLGPNQAPQRSAPPAMSAGLANLSEQAGLDLHEVTGIYPASLGARSNETSGVAIRARQHEGDTGSNYIQDNLKRAIAYSGRVLIDAIPHFYDTERVVRMLKESGDHEMAKINAADPTMDPDAEEMIVVGALMNSGKFGVVVSTGPSYMTRQQEMADTMVDLAKSLPIVGQAAPDILVKSLNFPGGDEIAERIQKLLPPGLTEEGPMQPPPPDPEKMSSALKNAAQADLAHAQTDLARANASKSMVEADVLANTVGLQVIEAITPMLQTIMQGHQQTQMAQMQPPTGPQSQGKLAPMGEQESDLQPMPGPPEPPPPGAAEILAPALMQLGQSIAQGMQAQAAATAELAASIRAPRKVTRDPKTGRVAGTEVDQGPRTIN